MDKLSLVKKARRGDKEALLTLIMKEKEDYYRLAYAYMKNEHDAMNALQDMIVRLYENIGSLRNKNKFYSWSKTILVNICKDELEKKKKLVLLDSYREEALVEDLGSDLELEEILGSLDPIYGDLIRFKYILGYDYRTMGEIFDLPVGTVKSRLYKGRKKLELILGEDEDHAR